MKILHLPLNVIGSEQIGQEKGFRETFEDYRQFDYLKITGEFGDCNQALIDTVKEYQPDLIWAQLQNTSEIKSETWATIRELLPDIWLTTWCGDARVEPLPYLIQSLPYFDIFYNATDQKNMYKSYCKRYEFMPIAVDGDEVTIFKEVENVPDVIFIGNHYGMDGFPNSRNRYETMATLTKELGNSFAVYGSGWPFGDVNILPPVEIKDQGSYYHAAKVVISMDHFNDMDYMSERRLWALASGTPVVLEDHPGAIAEFGEASYIFNDLSNCVDLVKDILSNPRPDGQPALDLVLNKYTWKQRAETVRRDYDDR